MARAREVLGSTGTTDTIRRALEQVVRQERLRQLAAPDFSDLSQDGRVRAWGA